MENMGRIAEGLLGRLASTPAVRNGRVYYLSDSLYRLGPRIVPGMKEMRRAVEGAE
jgi:ABC-type hemin transport system substrate-binding protein